MKTILACVVSLIVVLAAGTSLAAKGATTSPSGLPRYQVSFYVTDNRFAEARPEELACVVLYEHDSASERDYVYLPGNVTNGMR